MRFLSALGVLTFSTICKATVVTNDAMITTDVPYQSEFSNSSLAFKSTGAFWYEISVSGYNSFSLCRIGILSINYNIFSVESGSNFDANYVNYQNPFFLGNYPELATLFIDSGETKYIGYWGQGPGSGLERIADDQDVYGWVLLANIDGGLTVTSSATAVGGGIKVGTLQEIPEPSTTAAIISTIVITCFRRRR